MFLASPFLSSPGKPLTFPPLPRLPATAKRFSFSVRNASPFSPDHSSSFYEVLRVERTASLMEIKTAYRSLAKIYHPDAAGSSDAVDFIALHDAYETLSNPASRALYDLSLGPNSRRSRRFRSRACPTRRWETDQCW